MSCLLSPSPANSHLPTPIPPLLCPSTSQHGAYLLLLTCFQAYLQQPVPKHDRIASVVMFNSNEIINFFMLLMTPAMLTYHAAPPEHVNSVTRSWYASFISSSLQAFCGALENAGSVAYATFATILIRHWGKRKKWRERKNKEEESNSLTIYSTCLFPLVP